MDMAAQARIWSISGVIVEWLSLASASVSEFASIKPILFVVTPISSDFDKILT